MDRFKAQGLHGKLTSNISYRKKKLRSLLLGCGILVTLLLYLERQWLHSLAFKFGNGMDTSIVCQNSPCSHYDLWNDASEFQWKSNAVSKRQLVRALAFVMRLEPAVSVNGSCSPPALPKEASCSGQAALTGHRFDRPKKIAQMLMISFESDALEISLRESWDIVDHIFLVESTRIHNPVGKDGRTVKPLMWEALRDTDRFKFLPKEKVVYIIVDDVDIHRATQEGEDKIWSVENLQTDIAIQKIQLWQRHTGALQDDDILITADIDEIISRETLHKLKWCEPVEGHFSGAVWMPMGNLNNAFRTDHPAPNLPFTITVPKVYNWSFISSTYEVGWKQIQSEKQLAKGPSWKFVTGGIHLTNPSFMPYQILKSLCATEYIGTDKHQNYSMLQIEEEQDLHYSMDINPDWKRRLANVSELGPSYTGWLDYVPWFLKCNQDRFPYWFGKSDKRNKTLLFVLRMLSSGESYHMAQHFYMTENGISPCR